MHDASITTGPTSQSALLEAFFLGRAFAQVLNERLGEAATDVLAQTGRFAAEWDSNVASFEAEVQRRAATALAEALGQPQPAQIQSTTPTAPPGGKTTTSSQDAAALVDEMRADIAATRAALQRVKQAAV